MFTKKPLGGMSCASCEKDIINLQGKKVNFHPWSKFPFRDPSERIARVFKFVIFYLQIQVGQGFSKMLSMINPETLSKFDTHAGSGQRYSSINGQMRHSHNFNATHGSQNSQEGFYHEEVGDTIPDAPLGSGMKPTTAVGHMGGKTMNHFYQSQQMQDLSKRPGSASIIPKPKVVSFNFHLDIYYLLLIDQQVC